MWASSQDSNCVKGCIWIPVILSRLVWVKEEFSRIRSGQKLDPKFCEVHPFFVLVKQKPEKMIHFLSCALKFLPNLNVDKN